MRDLTIYEKAAMFDRIIDCYKNDLIKIKEFQNEYERDVFQMDNVGIMGGRTRFLGDLAEYLGQPWSELSPDNELIEYEKKLRDETDCSFENIKQRNQRLQNKINHFAEYMLGDCDDAFMTGANLTK
jgi:hypothetical protein